MTTLAGYDYAQAIGVVELADDFFYPLNSCAYKEAIITQLGSYKYDNFRELSKCPRGIHNPVFLAMM